LKKKLLAALAAPGPLASVNFLLWRFFLPGVVVRIGVRVGMQVVQGVQGRVGG